MPDSESNAAFYTKQCFAYYQGRSHVENLEQLPSDSDVDTLIHSMRERSWSLRPFKHTRSLPRISSVLGLLKGLRPDSLLDLGTGRGSFLMPLLNEPGLAGFPICATDSSPALVQDLHYLRVGGEERLRSLCLDASDLPFKESSFDVVTALEILEHLHTPAQAAQECLRVAKRYVVASVPSKPD